ncbi:quorum sensing transcriptional regulator of LYSR-type [Shigella sonnei 4822-66]|nr:quorum sensing transcriptional regulator of LYSR-type [Shigella sonnei 4822-66]
MSKLEDELQVKLLNRSTRSIGLTEAGRIYYQGCRRMLHEVQDVHEQLYAFNNTPIGTLRIGCSSTMAQNVLAGLTAKMLKEYPGLSVNLVTGIPACFPAVWARCRWWCAPRKAISHNTAYRKNPPI